eukprot:GGOE01031361.1.p1 GENE.GGOE01031361.1~~GGOE01031361.1.p1  ORF type:complete len:711 (-),score=198.49 GGOE01031361.1:160-2292(-)
MDWTPSTNEADSFVSKQVGLQDLMNLLLLQPMLWRLGPHSHPLARLYRFKDQSLEDQYQHKTNDWCRWPVRMHCCCCLFFALLDAASFTGNAVMPPAFWVYVGFLSISVVMLVSSYIFNTSLIMQHGVYCLVTVGLYCLLMHLQSFSWASQNYNIVVPDGMQLLAVGNITAQDVVVGDRLMTFLLSSCSTRAFHVALINTLLIWVTLGVMGLNVCTLGICTAITVGFTITLALAVPMLAGDIVQSVLHLFVIDLACLVIAITVERTRRSNFVAEVMLTRELQASQMADSILNHMLKNILADVAGNLELFLAGMVGDSILQDGIACLSRGISACKERHVYLKLVTNEYLPVMNVVNLKQFGQQLIAGRNVVGRFPNVSVYMDGTLCNLVMENAISNAIKHSCPEDPDIRFTIEEIPGEECPDLQPGLRRFCFRVTNTANLARPPLTPDLVQKLFKGRAELQRGEVHPKLSDGIGLPHCALAAAAGGMRLSLQQDGQMVAFSATLDTDAMDDNVQCAPQLSRGVWGAPGDFPSGLVFAILDDSMVAQRLLQFHIQRLCSPKEAFCFGAVLADVDAFMAKALEEANVVIIDQHLVYPEESLLGTDLVRKLLQLRFDGLICIRSADDAPEDRTLYLQSGAHCCVGKDTSGPAIVEELKRAYLRHVTLQASSISFDLCADSASSPRQQSDALSLCRKASTTNLPCHLENFEDGTP